MSEAVDNYEQVSVYNLSDERRETLLREHAECSFAWTTKDGWPVAVIMSYLWQDGRFWLTAGAHRHRIEAVRRDPRVCITITSTGSSLGPGKSITAKGRCTIREDRETKDWFYPAFSAAPAQGSRRRRSGSRASSTRRSAIVLEVECPRSGSRTTATRWRATRWASSRRTTAGPPRARTRCGCSASSSVAA